MRSPIEILGVLDEAQIRLNLSGYGDDFNLRDLLWEVLNDVLVSVEFAANRCLPEPHSTGLLNEVADYLVNYYGDE